VDYHTHTDYTDGTAGVHQMADAAASKGLDEILFSEHVRHTSTYYPSFVAEVRGVKRPGLKVYVGVETKILDDEGHLDCSPEIASLCDAIVGSVHNPPPQVRGAPGSWSKLSPNAALELEFRLALAIVAKSRAHILAHPLGMAVTKFDLRPLDRLYELACACRDFDKAFELNARYCASPRDWIDIVQRAGCKVSFGSDAHKTADVARAWNLFRV
jgi:histidinol phosphatase-like PHP family hydrolase